MKTTKENRSISSIKTVELSKNQLLKIIGGTFPWIDKTSNYTKTIIYKDLIINLLN